MPLVSNLFKDNERLQACLIHDSAHVPPGSIGEHVALIQIALGDLDGAVIDDAELEAEQYGPSTAAAVLDFKQDRNIINFSYQTTADNIVGKMTIAALDKEMFDRQFTPAHTDSRCKRLSPVVNPAPPNAARFVGKKFTVA